MSPLDDGIEATITTPVASTGPSSRFSHSQNELMIGETSPNVMDEDCESEEVPTQSQFELTQQTQELTPDECSNLPPLSLSPPPAVPWGRLVPCVPAAQAAVELSPEKDEYWFGRSSTKSDVAIQAGVGLCKKEKVMMAWGHSMISNRHCRIFKISDGSSSPQVMVENSSGNGTWINSTIFLRKGEQRILHSGDEICLVNPITLRKKLTSERVLQAVMQQYSFIFIQSVNRKPCVNPRAMNYFNRSTSGGACSPRSSGRRIEAYYDLREVLGDGTSGQVRRGIHRQTGKEYAVKIISLRRQMDTKSMEDEVNMLRSLDHPYIVQLSDVFVQSGIAMYLVMELVAGGDLFDRIVEQQRYPEVEARRLMRRLLSAVFYLHESCNIVHRDLKPENILCSSPTEVKLADFGLAKMIESDGLKTFCGTPQYFAPEVLERRHTALGQGRYGKPADMWSLGVVLYIILAGAPPFGADIDTPQPFTIDFEESLWRGMPLAEDLVQQMLRTDPKRRLSIRQACDHPWINMDDGDTHIHPLEDPNVTARKRLFAESEIGGEKRRLEDTASESASLDDGNNSVASKGSIMSKEDFAHAAVSHCRDDSIFHLSPEKLSSNHNNKNVQNGPQLDKDGDNHQSSSVKQEDSSPMEISPSKKNGCGKNRSNNNSDDPVTAQHDESQVDDSPITTAASTSPEAAVALQSQTSVTPECDEVSPHRSPLETLNLNERTKRFRDRVLRRADEEDDLDEDRPSSPGIGGTTRGRDGTAVVAGATAEDSAATPHISNVRNKAKDGFGLATAPSVLPVEEDPILSEFSSGPSSLESFPDTPPAKTKPTRKRPFEDTTTTSTSTNTDGPASGTANHAPPQQQEPDTKRRTKQKRQTTLSSWFVTKKNVD